MKYWDRVRIEWLFELIYGPEMSSSWKYKHNIEASWSRWFSWHISYIDFLSSSSGYISRNTHKSLCSASTPNDTSRRYKSRSSYTTPIIKILTKRNVYQIILVFYLLLHCLKKTDICLYPAFTVLPCGRCMQVTDISWDLYACFTLHINLLFFDDVSPPHSRGLELNKSSCCWKTIFLR